MERIPFLLDFMERFYTLEGYPFDHEGTRARLRHFLSTDTLGRIWVITSEQAVVGYVVLCFGFSFEHGGKDAFLDEFFILDKYRNQGLGSRTMEFVEARARELGVSALHLEVEHGNKTAHRPYLRNGFKNNNRSLLTKAL